jgi:hypothetical protein
MLSLCPAGLSALRRPGNDLLSHTLRCSTIGAEGLHFRVRNGIGYFSLANATRSSKRTDQQFRDDVVSVNKHDLHRVLGLPLYMTVGNQANRVISTS